MYGVAMLAGVYALSACVYGVAMLAGAYALSACMYAFMNGVAMLAAVDAFGT